MAIENELPQPEIELWPSWDDNNAYRLVCHFGWSEEASHAFENEEIETLELSGGSFLIPRLGKKALELKNLEIRTSGIVEGLEQFENIEELTVEFLPENGLDLSLFPKLIDLSFEREKSLEKQLDNLQGLRRILITGYSGTDCSVFPSMQQLESLTLIQGRLRSLQGLESCHRLQELDLALIRGLEDITAIHTLSGLKKLSLANLPKAEGTLKISRYPEIEFFYMVKSANLSVDMSGLRGHMGLRKLWLVGSVKKLDWPDVFTLPELEMVSLPEGPTPLDDDMLRSLATRHGKMMKSIQRTGPKRDRNILIKFHTV